jgi:hypothetical protein
MATAWLKRADIEGDTLPPICARCGRPTTEGFEKNLAGTLVWLDPAAALGAWRTGHARVRLPLCRDHCGHWRRRWLILPVSLALLASSAAGFALLSPDDVRDDETAWLLILLVVLLHAPFVAMMWLGSTGIRATEASRDHLILAGVCEAFSERYPNPSLTQFTPIDRLDLDRAVLDRWGERGRPERGEPDRYRRDEEREDR